MIDVVRGPVERGLVEDEAGKVREGPMSPVYRNHLDERSSSDVAFQDVW